MCFWLTIDLPAFFVTGGRADGFGLASLLDARARAERDAAELRWAMGNLFVVRGQA